MAVVVAEAGFQLRAWARRPGSLDVLGSAEHVRHDHAGDGRPPRRLEEEDMEIFATAMTDAGVNADAVTGRGLTGARRLPELIRRLNP
jgi:hypothetical protein